MQVSIKKGGGLPYARKGPYEYQGTQYEADLKSGDIITILDGGVEEQGTYGKQLNFKVKTRNGEKKLSVNQKSRNVLAEAFGTETEGWVNKNVNVILKKDVIAGKKVEIVYLVVDGWEMDDYGDLVKIGDAKIADQTKVKEKLDKTEQPIEEIDPADIPF